MTNSATTSRIIDLTLTFRQGMRGVDWETARTVERDGGNALLGAGPRVVPAVGLLPVPR
jgi:hypothetical protein